MSSGKDFYSASPPADRKPSLPQGRDAEAGKASWPLSGSLVLMFLPEKIQSLGLKNIECAVLLAMHALIKISLFYYRRNSERYKNIE